MPNIPWLISLAVNVWVGSSDQPLLVLVLYADIGITVEEGIFVSGIEPGSAASADDSVTVGDRLLSVSS